mgnify:CR=1 FL=1
MTDFEKKINNILQCEALAGYDAAIVKSNMYAIYMPCHNWYGEMIGPTIFDYYRSFKAAWEDITKYNLKVRLGVFITDEDTGELTMTTEHLNDR